MSPRGRRPGGENTRARILEAARAEFAELMDLSVDPSVLVAHVGLTIQRYLAP